MKTNESSKKIRKQLKDSIPRKNIWYFSESATSEKTPDPERKAGKHDTMKTISEKSNHLVPMTPDRNSIKKECSFVVDWQLSDSF